jgi:hypothetical protein
MDMRVRSTWFVLGLFGLTMCGSDDHSDLGSKFDLTQQAKSTNDLVLCRCAYDDAQVNSGECGPDDPPTPAERQCILDALSKDPAVTAAYLDCIYSAFKAENDCRTEAGNCGTQRGEDECGNVFDSRSAACYLPKELERATDDC